MTRILTCIVCGKEPERAIPEGHDVESPIVTPYAATLFYTHGHYGSTFWDSFEGEQVAIAICDSHLEGATPAQIAFLRPIRQHPTRWAEISRHEADT